MIGGGRRMTPHEMEQAVYNGVKRALLEAVQLSFLGVAAAWLAYEYGGTVLSLIGAGLGWLLTRLIGG
jgi:hypothetical protein